MEWISGREGEREKDGKEKGEGRRKGKRWKG